MNLFSSCSFGSILTRSGLREILDFSPEELTAIGLATIVSPESVSIFAEPDTISFTVPVKVLFSPIKLATNEFTGVSYNSFGPESC